MIDVPPTSSGASPSSIPKWGVPATENRQLLTVPVSHPSIVLGKGTDPSMSVLALMGTGSADAAGAIGTSAARTAADRRTAGQT